MLNKCKMTIIGTLAVERRSVIFSTIRVSEEEFLACVLPIQAYCGRGEYHSEHVINTGASIDLEALICTSFKP